MFLTHHGGFRVASLLAAAALSGLCVVSAGCGKSMGPWGTVSGKVTYDDQAVTAGTVVFISAQGRGASAELDSQGGYTLKTVNSGQKIPVGEYQVGVMPPRKEVDYDAPVKETAAADYPNVPRRYRDHATSGWTFTVKEGPNTFNLEMKK